MEEFDMTSLPTTKTTRHIHHLSVVDWRTNITASILLLNQNRQAFEFFR
jgi:hypothetical protein